MWSGISSLGRATRPSGNSGKSRTGATTEILRRVVAGARPLVPVGMPTTAIVWFRRDLRVHDHPSLTAAARGADRVVPVFVVDDALLEGRHASVPRTSFMLDCLRELREALRERGADLIVRHGRPEHELRRLAQETGADTLHFASDVSPYAMARDRRVVEAVGIEVVRHPGLFVADVDKPRTRDGRPFNVFSPFHRAWQKVERRQVHAAPRSLALPSGLDPGSIPSLDHRLADPFEPGETAARARMHAWLRESSRSGRARARAPRSSSASSRGATSTRTCCSTTPATPAAPTSPTWTSSSGRTTTRASRPGATAAPASRSSTPGCASSARAAGCTTGRG